MTRKKAIENVCEIIALAYHSIGDYSEPSDGFCERCEKLQGDSWHYENSGKIIKYVRKAVVNQLKKDGFEIEKSFDPITGKER